MMELNFVIYNNVMLMGGFKVEIGEILCYLDDIIGI